MRSRAGSSANGPGGTTSSSTSGSSVVGINLNSSTSMERNGGGGGSGGGGRSRLHHKRRPGHRRNTQHSVATVEPICDMRKVVNGVVTVDQDKLNKLVQTEPIDLHYAVEEEPFASGLFATVRKCRHRITGVEYAAKYAAKMRYGQDCTTEILHEIALMSLCTTNPRIIHLIDVFDTPTHMILVMEYAPGGDLQTLMDDDMVPYERDAVKFVRQVLEGLLFLHERNMAHLDIKLQNVLLMGTFPDCDVKLCDLEISRVIVAGQEVRELLGTPDYVSPEILHYEPITLSADIWSVGVMAYVLLTGFTPFGGDTDQETFQNICHGQLDFPDELFEDISPQAEDFIRKTLSREPSCRPTVKECLKHPWLTSWKNVASHQRETISSESQRKSSGLNNGPSGSSTLACPRSAAAGAASINGHNSSPSTTARSLQRAMSKSREVLYERVAASNLRKSTSKSRERLCEMRLSVSRSRDHLCDVLHRASAAQSRERLHSLRNLSKSHEVLSLLNEQGSTLSDTSSLFHLLPSTQSLECFVIPPLEAQKIRADPLVVDKPPDSGQEEAVELTKSLSESTETLCGETEMTTQIDVADEITPSNSRSETPTQEIVGHTQTTLIASNPDQSEKEKVVSAEPDDDKKDEDEEEEEKEEKEEKEEEDEAVSLKSEAVLARADAVASSLKRLSSNGPPPLKIPTPCDSMSPVLGGNKPAWNWPSPITNLLDSCASKSPVSPTGHSSGKTAALPSPSPLPSSSPSPLPFKDKPSPTSPSPADESRKALGSDDVACSSSPSPSVLSPLPSSDQLTPASPLSPTSIDTASLTDSQRQLLTSCLNRRRASWACGSRQDQDVSTITNAPSVSMVNKQTETKLSVSELISSFNQCQVPSGGVAAAVSSVSNPSSGLVRPSSVKKLSVGFVFNQESPSSSAASTSKAQISEKEKSVFKPLSSSIQVFQKNLPVAGTAVPGRSLEVSARPRSHHLVSWDVRALPRLPEDTDVVSSPRQEEVPVLPVVPQVIVNKTEEKNVLDDAKEKITTAIATAPEMEEDCGLRSGSVSSDTGCSSSSDLSDRSSDEGLDAAGELRCKKRGADRECGNGSEPEADLIEGALTSPSISWTGRPRSFSVQSEISLLAQPWNRVCNGSVARAFEKFGTKVESEAAPAAGTGGAAVNPSATSLHRSRRQSTPGPFK